MLPAPPPASLRPQVSLFQDESSRPSKSSAYSVDELTTFISYAKEHCEPQLTEDAAQELSRGYLDMRRGGLAGGKNTITATTRQLESLIRLSEAHARMRLSPEVSSATGRQAGRQAAIGARVVASRGRAAHLVLLSLPTRVSPRFPRRR